MAKLTLCGSTRFAEAFNEWNKILTIAGHTVYSIAMAIPRTEQDRVPEVKRRLDLVHLQKIYESDAIVVLNVEGYYGESTTREIEFARMNRKDIYWLENTIPGKHLGVSIWRLQNLFDDQPIASIPETKKYKTEAKVDGIK